jgi:hypothetical protein
VDYTDWGYVERHEHTNHPDRNPVHFQFYPDGKNGLGIAAGINLTKHTVQEVESWGKYTLDIPTISQLAQYAGLTYNELPKNHPTFTDAQLDNMQAAATKAYQETLSGLWNKYQSEHNSKGISGNVERPFAWCKSCYGGYPLEYA